MSDTDDIRKLMLQIQAGILLLEEVMDAEVGGDWVKPHRGSSVAGRYAWGQLSIAWINLGSMLLRDPSVEAWTIPPLVSRGAGGEQVTVEFGPAGNIDISPFEGSALELRDKVPDDLVRIVDEPKEPRYTLDEARRLLDICQQHHWEAEVVDGRPVGVICTTDGCNERRPLR